MFMFVTSLVFIFIIQLYSKLNIKNPSSDRRNCDDNFANFSVQFKENRRADQKMNLLDFVTNNRLERHPNPLTIIQLENNKHNFVYL